MIWALYIGGGLLALFAVFMAWGLLHIRQSRSQAYAEIGKIELMEIDLLARECLDVFERKLSVRLNLDDCEETARKLDDAFQNPSRLKAAFQRDDFYWYFVKPTGACLGELLRRHAKHEWRKKPAETPHMELTTKDGQSEAFPFEKVIKQISSGEPGDLVAYVVFARTAGLAESKPTTS